MADYYRKAVNNTANDVKLKTQIGVLTVKITENTNKINDLLEVDKNIKKDIVNNSNSIKNMKNEIDLKLSDKIDKNNIDNLLSDNYYDKNNIDLKFGDLYNKTYIDHKLDNIYDKNNINLKFNDLYNKYYLDNKFDNIYDKTEINNINSKLNRNIVLFNTNLTIHINKFSNFSTNISNLDNTQNSRLKQLEENEITNVQKNKINSLENIDLGKINSSYNYSVFNKSKIDKIRYYIKEFFMYNIDLVRQFNVEGETDFLLIYQFEIDRDFKISDIIKFFISIKFIYENMNKTYWLWYMKMDVHYKNEILIKSFKKYMVSEGFLFKNLAQFNNNNMFKVLQDTNRLIFKIYMHKVNTAYNGDHTFTLSNQYEENYCNIDWYTII